MVVTVRGNINDDRATGAAIGIEFNDSVEGTVSSVDAANNTLVVLGQTVMVDASTVFEDGVSLSTLQAGNLVEVSGMPAADGTIRATRIELKSAAFTPGDDTLELTGKVSGLNAVEKTFMIGDQPVNYEDAVLRDLPGGLLGNGLLVEVKSTAGLANGVLAASAVEAVPEILEAAQGDRVEVEGLAIDVASSSEFTVDGFVVSTTSRTAFENGSAADIAPDAKLEVEGLINGDGILVAEKVSFRLPSSVRLEGRAQNANLTAGTITLLGVAVEINNLTQMEDRSSQNVSSFDLADISIGDWLEVRAFVDGNGQAVASRIERQDAGTEVLLQGPASDLSSPSFKILAATVQTSLTTEFENAAGQPISRLQFFSATAAGSLVKARGALSGTSTIQATKVEQENGG